MALCLGGATRRGKDDAPRLVRADGSPVAQMLNLSALSEQMLIHENACVSIDKEMPLDRAAVIGCACSSIRDLTACILTELCMNRLGRRWFNVGDTGTAASTDFRKGSATELGRPWSTSLKSTKPDTAKKCCDG